MYKCHFGSLSLEYMMDGHYSEDEANQQNITKHIEHSQTDKGNSRLLSTLTVKKEFVHKTFFFSF